MPQDLDYEALGFKCGLEIHQQLLTEKKLFCRCPVQNRTDDTDMNILRHMRPTLSEMGTYDGTALMEFKTKKQITYQLYEETVCTYEMDDTPPFPINQKALDISLELTMLFGCSTVDELHVSRKQYLDGSIPTGFQRTAITGIDGEVPYRDGRTVRIRQISIEEDSCREMDDRGHNITFKTDRLGTPLVEVVTEPDIKHPSEVAEVASLLGRAMRGTMKVRRGMGATRQDVNVSIEGGSRVEIKGVPKLQWMEALTANEARRQKALLDIREELESRWVTEENLETIKKLVTPIFSNTRWGPMAEAIKAGGEAGAVLIRGFHGILGRETQEHVPFLHEFMGRVRVIACLDGEPNLLDMSALERVLRTDELRDLKVEIGWTNNDALVLVWGPKEDVLTAMDEIEIRAKESCVGVPNETRQAFADGTTTFERILPGPDRMYPDTDHPPVAITKKRLEEIKRGMTEPSWTRENRYLEMGLPPKWASRLSYSNLWPDFEKAMANGVEPKRAARAILVEGVDLRRKGVDLSEMDEQDALKCLSFLKTGIPLWSWKKWVEGGMKDSVVADEKTIEKAVEKLSKDGNNDLRRMMGAVMRKFDGMAPVSVVLDKSNKILG